MSFSAKNEFSRHEKNYITFWKRHNYGDNKKISGFQWLGHGLRWGMIGKAQRIFREMKI